MRASDNVGGVGGVGAAPSAVVVKSEQTSIVKIPTYNAQSSIHNELIG